MYNVINTKSLIKSLVEVLALFFLTKFKHLVLNVQTGLTSLVICRLLINEWLINDVHMGLCTLKKKLNPSISQFLIEWALVSRK